MLCLDFCGAWKEPNVEVLLVSFKWNLNDVVCACAAVLLRSAAMTIRAGGNVLVPCYSSGVIYDLLECLYQFIESANLGTTPFYFISPIANSSLEFSQIFAEWWAAVYRKLLDSVVKVCDFRFYCFSSACARLACLHFSTSSTTSHDVVTLIIRNTVSMFCYLIEMQQTVERR